MQAYSTIETGSLGQTARIIHTGHVFRYKGFTCIWNAETLSYDIYTKDEMSQPAGFRYPEMDCETIELCRDFIDSY